MQRSHFGTCFLVVFLEMSRSQTRSRWHIHCLRRWRWQSSFSRSRTHFPLRSLVQARFPSIRLLSSMCTQPCLHVLHQHVHQCLRRLQRECRYGRNCRVRFCRSHSRCRAPRYAARQDSHHEARQGHRYGDWGLRSERWWNQEHTLYGILNNKVWRRSICK